MRIRVDEEKCVGAGQCARVAPDIFDQDEYDGLVMLLDPAPPEDQNAAVLEAAESCPVHAILVADGVATP